MNILNGFPFPEEKYKQKHHKGAIIRLKLDYNCLLIHKDNMRAYSFCLQMINIFYNLLNMLNTLNSYFIAIRPYQNN
ncbi:unnamed protein product [Brugia timori]|uniref:Uncharacterized protein n=1 Tax=Brugia timori TaxID=42155 RepID=A0A0R3QXJ9_9BILA|nr:unnamed protein product [Brugia timori]